ncbi:hypothetical protein Plhal304r1_c052g0136201 [Plasmopara halstedii]
MGTVSQGPCEDEIKEKLLEGLKGPPKIIKGEAHEIPKESKKKHTYVPQPTDADFNKEEPTAPGNSPDDFYCSKYEVAQKAINTRAYI